MNDKMTVRQATVQHRAKSAWDNVESVNDKDKYGTLARKLPSMLQINGLGATLAFLQAKGKGNKEDGHAEIFDHVSKWVLGAFDLSSKHTTLMDLVRDADVDTYRRATTEAIEYAIWLKRYVEAKDWGSVQGDNE